MAKKFWALHVENVLVPPQSQEATFLKAREIVEGMGFRMQEFATNSVEGAGAGNLIAMNSEDGFKITLHSTSPPEEIGIMISSPCLERAPEEQADPSTEPESPPPRQNNFNLSSSVPRSAL
ncbi:hypothetical protein B4N89_09215 [Embleya scabrispora]|uniref:Uncharacterized protein n=2 Tax=Embleya scabrispora TaxID=159449 RepID=A0A1T3NW97_9ACTN|nr:hypothetical protein B4N89_09215 [Embleya scabrispora]